MKKKLIFFLLCIALISPFIIAQDYKINIETTSDIFKSGEPITLKVTLLDSSNNPINEEIFVILEDAEKRTKLEKTIHSNEIVSIEIGNKASYGQGTITVQYQGQEANGFFNIEIKEEVSFELKDDTLIITNIGNTQYTKTVQITIGDTTGNKYPKLNIGESVSYKLVAPEGIYNIRVSDGKTTLTEGEVKLTGTGKVIGVLDETASKRSPVTGGVRPDEDSETGLLSYMKNGKFTYVFIFVIFAAGILLAIERRFKKKISK
ncbi:MAG: hypothetical protein KKF48_04425 [Nanoarchaeota archaeon]|nr:hypothetical protein [Nanoarchaeota archaeon]MBU1028261.1 hypothetical protein [Nanoarchaeota archaeon]